MKFFCWMWCRIRHQSMFCLMTVEIITIREEITVVSLFDKLASAYVHFEIRGTKTLWNARITAISAIQMICVLYLRYPETFWLYRNGLYVAMTVVNFEKSIFDINFQKKKEKSILVLSNTHNSFRNTLFFTTWFLCQIASPLINFQRINTTDLPQLHNVHLIFQVLRPSVKWTYWTHFELLLLSPVNTCIVFIHTFYYVCMKFHFFVNFEKHPPIQLKKYVLVYYMTFVTEIASPLSTFLRIDETDLPSLYSSHFKFFRSLDCLSNVLFLVGFNYFC